MVCCEPGRTSQMCEKHDLHHILGVKHGNSQMLCMLASISTVCSMFDLDNKYCKAQVWATTVLQHEAYFCAAIDKSKQKQG